LNVDDDNRQDSRAKSTRQQKRRLFDAETQNQVSPEALLHKAAIL
jgi:hypothetical protein